MGLVGILSPSCGNYHISQTDPARLAYSLVFGIPSVEKCHKLNAEKAEDEKAEQSDQQSEAEQMKEHGKLKRQIEVGGGKQQKETKGRGRSIGWVVGLVGGSVGGAKGNEQARLQTE